MTETNYAEFDELHRTWLAPPHLHLLAIISLARGIPPEHWGEAHKRYRSDCLALKAAITAGLLKAHRDDPSQMRYDNTVVYLPDLLRFLDKAGPEYEWLRKFAERWRQYCALPAIKVDGAGKIKPRATHDVEKVTRAYRDERSIMKPFPGIDEDWKWCKARFPGFKRQTFRDEVRKPFVPEDAQLPGPRKRAAPAK